MYRQKDTTAINDPNSIQINWIKTKTTFSKICRLYEDDDFVIDLFPDDPAIRVSIFEDGHYKDEVFIKKKDYIR